MTTDVSRQPHAAAASPPGPSRRGPGEQRAHHSKPRKFSSFMKRLANLKSSSHSAPSTSAAIRPNQAGSQRSASFSHGSESKYAAGKVGKTRPLSHASSNGHLSFAKAENGPHHQHYGSTDSFTTTSSVSQELDVQDYDEQPAVASTKSRPPPSATTATTSAWSSPTPSVRSLTTTLTTIHSTAPGSTLNSSYNPHPSHHHNPNGPPQMYSAPFPSGSENPPHSPAAPSSRLLHPTTYNAATANGVWTDNASIITLASSSKRMRRRSVDTDASVRALAPSSVFGGSRESLPLSVLSGNLDSGPAGRDRGSLYGTSSLLGRSNTNGGGDNASVHGGAGSIRGEISGSGAQGNGSPLVSPAPTARESLHIGRHSRRSSAWAIEVDDTDRRSLSARSASLRCDVEGDEAEVVSVRDGSSSVGVWHGVIGKPEKKNSEVDGVEARKEG